MRSAVLPLAAALAALPSLAQAGGEVQVLSQVLLVDAEAFEGGSLIGPPESRAAWYSLGGITPFEGNAMVAFSTGELGTPPVPGTDLGAVGEADDIAGLNLALRVPTDAHSLRLGVRVLAPLGLEGSQDDVARVLLQGDELALDPWEWTSLHPTSLALGMTADSELEGTGFEDGGASSWLEAVVPVTPDSQVSLRIEVRDQEGEAGGDLVLLADGLVFDRGAPSSGSITPGWAPLLRSANPELVLPDTEGTILLSGRSFPPEGLELSLVDGSGAELLLDASRVTWLSADQLEVNLPPLSQGEWGIRLDWPGGAISWGSVFEVNRPVPQIDRIQPSVGPPEGGGLAVLEGSGFHLVTRVLVGGFDALDLTVASPQRLELVLPPGLPGEADLELFAAGGHALAPALFQYSGVLDPEPSSEGNSPPTAACALAVSTGAGGTGLLLLVGLGGLRRRRAPAGPRPASG